ncbi:unnamed protein product [Symbiodinium pilosum]|uniref:Uncharacterized protein n=1 Tax=Symbiodinium pilosum TaxID=2952 RepID=A0A812L2V9_SYMPI|nr:unnamed protein product [Symbiodinium pilosum]
MCQGHHDNDAAADDQGRRRHHHDPLSARHICRAVVLGSCADGTAAEPPRSAVLAVVAGAGLPTVPSEGVWDEPDSEAWQEPDVAAATELLVDIANASSSLEEAAVAQAAQNVRHAETQIWNLAREFDDSPAATGVLNGTHHRTLQEEPPVPATLRAVYQLCPGWERASPEELAEEVLRKASQSSPSEALRLMRCVAGVSELNSAGATPSKLALRASLAAFSAGQPVQEIAVFLVWLSAADAVRLMEFTIEDQSATGSRHLEVIAHLRTQSTLSGSDASQLEEVLRQAEALILLRTLVEGSDGEEHFPMRLLPGCRLGEAVAAWRQQLAVLPPSVREAAQALLDTGFDSG